MRILVLLATFLFVSCSAFGQTPKQQQQYDLADSLGATKRFGEAQSILNQLLRELSSQKQTDIAFRLEVMHQKGHLYDASDESTKAIKIIFEVLDQARKNKQFAIQTKAQITLALIYEKMGDLSMCRSHLNEANKLLKKHKLDEIYAQYCVRFSSYLRYVNKQDSAIYYAREALKSATELDQYLHISDANMLLGILLHYSSPFEAIKHYEVVAHRFLSRSKFDDAGAMYSNISEIYLENNMLDEAFLYSDSAFWASAKTTVPMSSWFFRHRVRLFQESGNVDSALYYMYKMHDTYKEEVGKQQQTEIQKLTEEYAAKKKDAIIQNQIKVNKKQQEKVKLLTASIITGIVVLLVLIFGFYQIRKKNKNIKLKTDQLANSLEEKEVLLSEVQHRVKNNLQIILGILEIQTESSETKSIEEITSDTMNRVRSMAILHNKLIHSDNLSHINIGDYFNEIIDLLKDSYTKEGQEIDVSGTFEVEEEGIDKSIPLGLILVELLSNSFKHAFGSESKGEISVRLELSDLEGFKYKLTYKDSGNGIDNNKEKATGMGMEIIHGLTSQLKGKITFDNEDGFTAILYY